MQLSRRALSKRDYLLRNFALTFYTGAGNTKDGLFQKKQTATKAGPRQHLSTGGGPTEGPYLSRQGPRKLLSKRALKNIQLPGRASTEAVGTRDKKLRPKVHNTQ